MFLPRNDIFLKNINSFIAKSGGLTAVCMYTVFVSTVILLTAKYSTQQFVAYSPYACVGVSAGSALSEMAKLRHTSLVGYVSAGS